MLQLGHYNVGHGFIFSDAVKCKEFVSSAILKKYKVLYAG